MRAQSCLTLCDPMDCSPPGSSIHEIILARILERVAMPSSRGSSRSKDRTHTSCIAGRLYTIEPPGQLQRLEDVQGELKIEEKCTERTESSWKLIFKVRVKREEVVTKWYHTTKRNVVQNEQKQGKIWPEALKGLIFMNYSSILIPCLH